MNTECATGNIRARVRDFSAWLPSSEDREAHPKPQGDAPLEEKAAFLEAVLPIIGKSDPAAWEPGGKKRVELDEAFLVLGLPALTWQGV